MTFKLLVLCHTVQYNESSSEIYQASSPDELSFIKFCSQIGLVYMGESHGRDSPNKIRRIFYKGTEFKYEILRIFDFDSDRKRMGIIVYDIQSREIIHFCKGAESSIFNCCISGNIQSCESKISGFARLGWRTLALSYKILNSDEYNTIDQLINEAYRNVLNREAKLSEALEIIESNFDLLGATGIEDKLQDDVAKTLETLRKAGIKIWVLTGDKLETAVNISHSCSHFSQDMTKIQLSNLTDSAEIKKKLIDYCEE